MIRTAQQREFYFGPLQSRDRTVRSLPLIGQINPSVEERFAMQNGRYLAAMGDVEARRAADEFGDEPDWDNGAIDDLEREDDVVGSGIFGSRSKPTVHQTMGVFQDNPSIPGYIARNPPFTVNRDVADITSGAQVVEVPGGSAPYVEAGGRIVGFPGGPCPPPSPRGIVPPTVNVEPYVNMDPGSAKPYPGPGSSVSTAMVPVPSSGPRPRPTRPGRGTLTQVPMRPAARPVPADRTGYRVPSRDTSLIAQSPTPAMQMQLVNAISGRDITGASTASTTPATRWGDIPFRSDFRGFGQEAAEEPEAPSVLAYAFAGMLVGAAAAVFVKAMGRGKR